MLSCVSASGAAKTTADDLPADVDTKRRKDLRLCAGVDPEEARAGVSSF